jgi:uncharacterized protein
VFHLARCLGGTGRDPDLGLDHTPQELKKRKSSAIIAVMSETDGPTAPSMMLGFRASNARSFKDPLEFSLEATAMSERDVPRLVPWRLGGGQPLKVLPAAGIYGANASGKTNFLRILYDMRTLVTTSFRSGTRATPTFFRPFQLDPDYENAPSTYDIDLVIEGIRYEYGFSIDAARVLSEYARYYPRGKAATIFRREHLNVRLGEDNRAKGRTASEILRPNSLYLSAAEAADHQGLQPLYQWFDSNLHLCEASTRPARWAYTTEMMTRPEAHHRVLAMLQAADLGITGARIREADPEMLDRLNHIMTVLQRELKLEESLLPPDDPVVLGIALSHQGARASVELDTADESLGTLVWLGLIGPVLDAMARGTVLLVDELEASLHPSLVAQLIRAFQNPVTNPRGAQIIFNSFDVGLIGYSVEDRIIGRDQVWFTEKLPDGRTKLYPLSDLSPRKAEALGRRYLDGRYGATPIITSAEFDAITEMILAESSND